MNGFKNNYTAAPRGARPLFPHPLGSQFSFGWLGISQGRASGPETVTLHFPQFFILRLFSQPKGNLLLWRGEKNKPQSHRFEAPIKTYRDLRQPSAREHV